MNDMPHDPLLRRLADFIAARMQRELASVEVENLTIRLIDAMACAVAARGQEEAGTLAASFRREDGDATLIGGGRARADDAAFYNSWLIRKLDWNDTYISKNGGHPSDFIGAVLALGEAEGCSGHDILRAIGVGTHVMLDFCDAASALSRGWDPSTYVAIGATAALAAIGGLPPAQIAHALAMTAVSRNMLMARTGRISGWKALASAVAVRDCMFHVALARRGLEGPDPAFTGEFGFERMISGPLPLELDPARDRSGDTHLKFYPAIYHAQGPIEAALDLHRQIAGAPIESVDIEIYDFALRYTADSPDKWSPANIETADHSLPFLTAHALLQGEFANGSLSRTLHDPQVRALAQIVRVTGAPEFTARWPAATPSRLVVVAGGRTFERSIEHIIGHAARPLRLSDIAQKFELAVAQSGRGPAQGQFEALARLADLPRLEPRIFGA